MGREELLRGLEEHYNGYRFSPDARERVFNSDMVLYLLGEIDRWRGYPRDMLDRNVRTEYGHLQRIGRISGAGTEERLSLLGTILAEGHIRSDIAQQFGVKSLGSRTHYLSLLYFLGMLTLGSSPGTSLGFPAGSTGRTTAVCGRIGARVFGRLALPVLAVISILAMRQTSRPAVRRALFSLLLLLTGCAAPAPAVDVPPSPCEQPSSSQPPTPVAAEGPSSWLDQKGSLRLEFEIEGLDPLDTTHALQIQVARALRARLREAGLPDVRVSWMNQRQIVVDLPGLADPSAVERARESLRAPGLPARLVFTVESLVGPAIP